jgi:hypothetical protein
LEGNAVEVNIVGTDVFINDAQVTLADVSSQNGVVHVINGVLLPEGVSINEITSIENLNVYPNPATDLVNLAFESKFSEPYELLIINEVGQVVLTKKGITTKGTNNLEVTIGSIKNGAYHALLKVGKSFTNKAFIIGN